MAVPAEVVVTHERWMPPEALDRDAHESADREPPDELGEADASRDNSADELADLAERQAGFMFRVAHGLLRNPQDAEDAVQETLLKLFRTRGWRGVTDERAFLARTVWRVGLDVAARRAKHRQGAEPIEGDGSYAAAGESAEATLVGAGQHALLRRLIDALPDELRQPLVLSAIDEMTSREVGEALGMPDATVRTRVMRARAELRRRYERMQAANTGGDAR